MADEINRMTRYTAGDIEDAIDYASSLHPLSLHTDVIEPEDTDTIIIGSSEASVSSYLLMLSSDADAANNGMYIVANSSSDCTVKAVSSSAIATVTAESNTLSIENTSSTDTIKVSLLRLF